MCDGLGGEAGPAPHAVSRRASGLARHLLWPCQSPPRPGQVTRGHCGGGEEKAHASFHPSLVAKAPQQALLRTDPQVPSPPQPWVWGGAKVVGVPTARPQSSPVRILTLCEPRRRQGKLAAHPAPGEPWVGSGTQGGCAYPVTDEGPRESRASLPASVYSPQVGPTCDGGEGRGEGGGPKSSQAEPGTNLWGRRGR